MTGSALDLQATEKGEQIEQVWNIVVWGHKAISQHNSIDSTHSIIWFYWENICCMPISLYVCEGAIVCLTENTKISSSHLNYEEQTLGKRFMTNQGTKRKGIERNFNHLVLTYFPVLVVLLVCPPPPARPAVYCLFPDLSSRRLTSVDSFSRLFAFDRVHPARGIGGRSKGRRRDGGVFICCPPPPIPAKSSGSGCMPLDCSQLLYVFNFSQMFTFQGLSLHWVPVISVPFPFWFGSGRGFLLIPGRLTIPCWF